MRTFWWIGGPDPCDFFTVEGKFLVLVGDPYYLFVLEFFGRKPVPVFTQWAIIVAIISLLRHISLRVEFRRNVRAHKKTRPNGSASQL